MRPDGKTLKNSNREEIWVKQGGRLRDSQKARSKMSRIWYHIQQQKREFNEIVVTVATGDLGKSKLSGVTKIETHTVMD